MRIEQKKVGDVVIVSPLEKRIEARLASEFKAKLAEMIGEGSRLIVLDMSEVDFIDSSGLGAIVSTLKLLGRSGEIVICGVRDTVMSMFKLTRMDKVFQVFEDEEGAAEALREKSLAFSGD